MTPLGAQATCAALVALDLSARAWRLHALARGAGGPITARSAVAINLLADAGATLTPMRLGGEPARIAGMRASGMSMPSIGVAIAYELVVAWPTLVALGVALAAWLAPSWLRSAGPGFAVGLREHAGWLLATLLVAAGLVLAQHRRRGGGTGTWQRMRRVARASWRGMPPGPVLLAVPCSMVNVVARTALLPALALALPEPPAMGALWLGSFLLVYGQLIFPTPAGAGAVDLGLLAGAAGEFAGAEAGMLLAWRWWSSGVTALGGLVVAAAMLRGRRRAPVPCDAPRV